MAISEILILGFQLLIGPTVLGFLIYCYYKVQNDPDLSMPTKMSLDVLESEKPPMDWEKLDDFPATEDSEVNEDDENDKSDDGSSDDETAGGAHGHSHGDGASHSHSASKSSGGHSHSHNGQPCHGHGGPGPDDELKIKLGVGPQGVKGRPNQGRPDPRTMKLMLLESIRDKKRNLEEDKETMDAEKYAKQLENLNKAEEKAKAMPTDPKMIEKDMEKKAIEQARNTARQQLGAIAKAKTELMKARAANRVPDEVFDMNLKRMETAEARFKKMLKATDKEFLEIIKAENKAQGMPTNPMEKREMEKRAMADARKTAKEQLEQIAKARVSLLQAKEAGRVPENVFVMNMNRMKAGETQFKKMVEAEDDELIEIMKQMQQKAMQMQRMQQQMAMKKQAEMMKAQQAKKAISESKIVEIDEDCEEIDMDQHEKGGDESVRMRKNVKSK